VGVVGDGIKRRARTGAGGAARVHGVLQQGTPASNPWTPRAGADAAANDRCARSSTGSTTCTSAPPERRWRFCRPTPSVRIDAATSVSATSGRPQPSLAPPRARIVRKWLGRYCSLRRSALYLPVSLALLLSRDPVL
jgi:hypothetical protein